MRKRILYKILLPLLVLCIGACGTNAYKAQAPADLEEQAQLDMEAGRYSDAQSKLEELLESESDNYAAVSLLAACRAAQAGVTMLELLSKASSGEGGGDEGDGGEGGEGGEGGDSGSPASTAFAIVPEVNAANMEHMTKASELMQSIPAAELTQQMNLQAGVFLSVFGFMRLKLLSEDPNALAALSPEEAIAILKNLSEAGNFFGATDGGLKDATSQMETAIQSSSGANEKEKIQQFISTL